MIILVKSMLELVKKLKHIQELGVDVKENGYFYREKSTAITASIACDRIDRIQSRNLLIALSEEYVQGAELPWEVIYPNDYYVKVSLPGCEFEKISCWPFDKRKKAEFGSMKYVNIPGMFHQLKWKEQKKQEKQEKQGKIQSDVSTVLLIMGTQSKLGPALADNLSNHDVIIATVGGKDAITVEKSNYVVDGSEEQFDMLFKELNSLSLQIVYCADLVRIAGCREELENNVNQNLFIPVNMVKALERTGKTIDLRFVVSSANSVTGNETEIIPESGILFGFANALSVESENIKSYCIDVDSETDVDDVCGELLTPPYGKAVAFRKGLRYICELQEVSDTPQTQAPFVKEDGVYLITGGTGALGLATASLLAEQSSLNLVLLSRKTIPEKAEWVRIAENESHHDHNLITSLIDIESKVKNLDIVSADIGDEESVYAVLKRVREKYHKINGVIHAAGAAYMVPVEKIDQEQLLQMVVPKIYGTFVLEECLKNEPLDFFILYSSVACVFSAVGQACYTAANAYMDSFSDYRNRRGCFRTLSLQWATWQEIGMAARQKINIDTITKTLPTKEALEALKYAILTYQGRVLTGKLNYESGLMAFLPRYYFSISLQIDQKVRSRLENVKKFQRLECYLGDKGSTMQVQESLIEVFKQCLGYDEVEVHQNIFELGAESLTIKKMYTKLKELYGEAIVQTDFFEYPTVAKLSDQIAKVLNSHNDNKEEVIPKDTLEDILDKLQSGSIDPEQALRIIGIQ